MENDMFVSYTGINQKLPIADFSDIDVNDDLLNPYSDINLGIDSRQTSFAPKNPYDEMLSKLNIQEPTNISTQTQDVQIPNSALERGLLPFREYLVQSWF